MERMALGKPFKSFRSIKLRKRVINLKAEEEDTSADFALEKEGDVTDFLKPRANNLNSSLNSEQINRSFIGILSSRPRKDSHSLTKKATMISKKKKLESERDPRETFNLMLEKINCLRLSSLQEEHRLKRENKRYQNESHFEAIKSFQTINKYWKKLENSIASKSRKRKNELLYAKQKRLKTLTNSPNRYFDKEHAQNKYSWYMGLRDSADNKIVETYVPINNAANGIYTRVSLCKDSDDSTNKNDIIKLNEEDYRELQVIGVQKLPLEIEAVNRVGPQYLKQNKIQVHFEEETIAEHYDPWVKARLM